jgi:radical SAM enzyme (TIGR01210 family)
MHPADIYPATAPGRDAFVLSRRGARAAHDRWRPQGVLVEEEPTAAGPVARVATVFLTGRECPWRCVMCDLWRHTTPTDTPRGAIARQIDLAIEQLRERGPVPPHVKLYNAGSFFDPRAVPGDDYEPIAACLTGFDRVIVESHPALIGPRLDRLRRALDGAAARGGRSPALEIAMGLETANPSALERLHKRFTLDQFSTASDRLRRQGASLRVFLLAGVPFIPRREQQVWLERSAAFAFDCGASVVSIIPTRPGNGALESLADLGEFEAPTLSDLEDMLDAALSLGHRRVLADLWDLDRLATCPDCLEPRIGRLRAINLTQQPRPRIRCARCAAPPTAA